MQKHRLRCFFLSFIFYIFYRRNSIATRCRYCLPPLFCDSKDTTYFSDIQLFTYNTTKKRNTLTVFVAASWLIWENLYPQFLNTAEQAGETSNTNLKTYSCLSYWAGSVSVLPGLKYFNLANATWNVCRRKGYFRMGYRQKLRFAACFKA